MMRAIILVAVTAGCSSPTGSPGSPKPATPAPTTTAPTTAAIAATGDAGAADAPSVHPFQAILDQCAAVLPAADSILLSDTIDVELGDDDRKAIAAAIRDSFMLLLSDREASTRRREYDAWIAGGAPMQLLQAVRVPAVPDTKGGALSVVAVVRFEDQYYGTRISTVGGNPETGNWFELDAGGTAQTRALTVGDFDGDHQVDVLVLRPHPKGDALLVLTSSRPDTELSRLRSSPGGRPEFEHLIDMVRVSESCPAPVPNE